MNKKIAKILLASLLVPAVAYPALANTTQLTLTGEVASVLSVQILSCVNGNIVSQDNEASETPTYGTVDFGIIDARGLGLGALTGSTQTGNPGKVVIEDGATHPVWATGTPPAATKGAVYFVPCVDEASGFKVVTNATSSATDVSVASLAASDIESVVDTSTILDAALGGTDGSTTIAATSVQPVGANATGTQIADEQENNVPVPITVGLFVKNTTETGVKTAVLEFTASEDI